MTGRTERLTARLAEGQVVLLDGATGTECERRGVPRLDGAWNGGAALSHPDVLRGVHRDYIENGAQIVIANTFATHRHVLQRAGVADDFEVYNRVACELAVQARSETVAAGVAGADDVVVAGGVSNWTWAGDHPSLGTLTTNSADQTRAQLAGGAELIILEMMIDIDRMNATLDGVEEAIGSSGVPIWVGFTVGRQHDTPEPVDGIVRLRDGEPLADALAVIEARGIDVAAVMHSEVTLIDAALDVMLAQWPGPVGVYAHSGRSVDGGWVYDDVISPSDYAAAAQRWLDRGVRIIGSCCGTTPDHIAALADLPRVQASGR